jgi:fatty acid synthase subunit beta
MAKTRSQREPELLRAARNGHGKIVALFGGQGSHNAKCLNELRDLQTTQFESTSNLLQRAGYLLEELANAPHSSGFHDDYGFNLERWLAAPSSAPPKRHLALAPISFPLNTLLGLAHYCIACRKVSSSPGQFNSALTCAVGYSQGVFAALAVALSNTWNDFWEAAEFAIRLSFAVGLESHRACPSSHIPAALRQQCFEDGHGDPSPMLSVRGLSRDVLASTIAQINRRSIEHDEGDVHLALEVSRDRHVLAGPVSALWRVYTHLVRMRALPMQDQGKVPFPDRKPVVDISFLPISAPFHSPYLAQVESAILDNPIHLPTSLSPTDNVRLTVPFYNTLDDSLISSGYRRDLSRSVVRAVVGRTVEWHRISQNLATQFTHLVDFGPGRIGDLTLQNVLGSGLTVIDMAYRESTDQSEIWSSIDFHQDQLRVPAADWLSRYGPRLVEGTQPG